MNARLPAAAEKEVAPTPPPVEAAPFPPAALREACQEILARYPTKMAAVLPVLLLAQRHFGGWISPEVEVGVARYLELSDSHVRGVLSFYAMFNTEPAGRHEVWICRSLTCWLRGAPALKQVALEVTGAKRSGVQSPDGAFLVKDMECLGLCEVAPAAFVGGVPYTNVTTESLREILQARQGAGEGEKKP